MQCKFYFLADPHSITVFDKNKSSVQDMQHTRVSWDVRNMSHGKLEENKPFRRPWNSRVTDIKGDL